MFPVMYLATMLCPTKVDKNSHGYLFKPNENRLYTLKI